MWGSPAVKPDITLAICPPWGVDMPPLGLAYLSAFLKTKGITTSVLDMNIETYNKVSKDFRKYWKSEFLHTWFEEQDFNKIHPYLKKHIKRSVKKILNSKSDIIGFSVNQSNMLFTLEVIYHIKQKSPSKKIIIGGQVCYFPQMKKIIFDYLNYKGWTNTVDFYIIGEGEYTLYEIIKSIKNGLNPVNSLGTEIYKTWMHIENPSRDFIKKLDELPFPPYEEFDKKHYAKPDQLPILMSRGCIGRCTFCNDHVITGPYRSRSAEHIFNELKFHVTRNGIKKFSCSDLLINGNLKELEKLCDLIIKHNLNVTFVGQAVVMLNMSDSLLNKMFKAGFHSLVFGIESLCDSVLKEMNKPFRLNDIEQFFPRAHKAGIKVFINLIAGFPGEGEEEFQETLDNIRKLRPCIDKLMDLSPCEIKYLAPLEANPEKYSYILPRYYYKWHTKDNKNTLEIRQERVRKILLLAEELNLPVGG